ncbi:MAG: HAMP domain-containing histidine kinase [Lachnospiraceae bacterium]|nr:HAMP domain-containing histidine kinase [Lachnospiraceae bacterium]
MSVIQKILLVLSCLLYAATIYGFFNLKIHFIIVLFLLHSLALLAFCLLTWLEVRESEQTSSTYHQEVGLELAEKNQEVSSLQEALMEKDALLSTLTQENEVARMELEEAKISIQRLKADAENARSEQETKLKASEESSIAALLPPLTTPENEMRTVDIIALANQAKEELEESARSANLIVTVSSSSDTLYVRADPNRLIVLFRNIIDNSIKYMNRAGSLVITISTVGSDIFIVLKDTGEGLPETETKHIFELNYQGSNRISGNGLGLAQARAIVEYYGGTIYAKSTSGKGMGIYIQLPA